jgi:hypothetical protein
MVVGMEIRIGGTEVTTNIAKYTKKYANKRNGSISRASRPDYRYREGDGQAEDPWPHRASDTTEDAIILKSGGVAAGPSDLNS